MSFRKCLKKVLFWGTSLVLTILIGAVGFAYFYVNDSNTLVNLIQAEAPRYLPGGRLELGRVQFRRFFGEINVKQIQLLQAIDGAPFLTLQIPWLHISHDPWAMLERRFEAREVVLTHPLLRLRRREDGTWNLQGLLANPWPAPPMKTMPPIVIKNGTIELVEGKDRKAVAILREVAIQVESLNEDTLSFEGTASGDTFDRVSLKGTIDRNTGQIRLNGDVARLTISDTLRDRLPIEIRPECDRLGLVSGEVDLKVDRLEFDPRARPPIRYAGSAQIRGGVWKCPKLPFELNGFSAALSIRDDVLDIKRAEGKNGATTVRVEKGRIGLGDPATAPLDLCLQVFDLELDDRLKNWTPPPFVKLWADYSPSGRIHAGVHFVREREGGPLGYGWTVDCNDVAILFRHFPYPIDHIRGVLICENDQIRLNLKTVVGNKPLTMKGTIDHPGPEGHAKLDFQGESLPIDETLMNALPPPIRKVVKEFQPSGTVRGRAHVERTKPMSPEDPREGRVTVDAVLDLNENCAIKWVGLPYPVGNLSGRLELHPTRWIFTDMRGSNGQAVITGSGSVEKLNVPHNGPGDPLKVDLHLNAENLPFNEQLRTALPPAWRVSWPYLNPVGSSDVDARMHFEPNRPDQVHLEINPKPETLVKLMFSREPQPGDPGGTFDLRMENVHGRFIYDDGLVRMHDVNFVFYGSPVQFESGTVKVENNGRFQLGVSQVWARDLRIGPALRKRMPPVMAQFAQRLDEGRSIATIKGNLGLKWEGPGIPVSCDWNNALVVFNDNTVQAGIPLEHLQGQLDNVYGSFKGEDLTVRGILRLDSVSLLGQQVTDLETPFHVEHGSAELTSLRGKLLGGTIGGRFDVSLEKTPRYSASLAVDGADLQRYAETLPGRQTFRGLIFGQLTLNGLGNDIHTLEGEGQAHIVQGNLGELPILLRLVKKLNLTAATKTAFDSADVGIKIRQGSSVLDPIKLTGNAISLEGQGTLDIQWNLDLRLQPRYGRARMHVPLITDALREASGQLFVVRIVGPVAYPRVDVVPLPGAADAFRTLGARRLSGDQAPR